jgi:pSer/pThr/pTyr-binding forkhead associated (FHA) protein
MKNSIESRYHQLPRIAPTGETLSAHLLPLGKGPQIAIHDGVTVMGRANKCDVCLDSQNVSKLHCVLLKQGGLLLLRDLGSKNGTRVNGRRVREAVLRPGDHLSIAGCQFRVLLDPAAIPGDTVQGNGPHPTAP